jgi:hypothetical protein
MADSCSVNLVVVLLLLNAAVKLDPEPVEVKAIALRLIKGEDADDGIPSLLMNSRRFQALPKQAYSRPCRAL